MWLEHFQVDCGGALGGIQKELGADIVTSVYLVWEIYPTFPLLAVVKRTKAQAEAYVEQHTHNAAVLKVQYYIEEWELE
jgi:hypothetical protein